MLLVVRPTSGNGLIPCDDLDHILPAIGFDFLVDSTEKITNVIDQEGSGFFHQDDLIEYLVANYMTKYTNPDALREALKTFDYDNDGRIAYDEFEYFMKNFGESEYYYMDEAKI